MRLMDASQAGGVHAVSEEFQAHARTRIEAHRLQRVRLGYVGQSHYAVIGTLEDASVGVTTVPAPPHHPEWQFNRKNLA